MASHPDLLRSPDHIFTPDPRSTGFSVLGADGLRPICLQDHYDSVARIKLHDGVPREIIVKFETAKNLNLFSWYVYRFHTAARSHAYECLEMALRVRFRDELYAQEERTRRSKHESSAKNDLRGANPYKPLDKEKFRPTLAPLLRYAHETGALKNEAFTAWHGFTSARARQRRLFEAIEEMTRLGLDEMQVDDSAIEPTAADKDHDYVGKIVETTPYLRNHYAHGTTSLDHKSLSALRLTAEIINQLFPKPTT